jgi:protein TonB
LFDTVGKSRKRPVGQELASWALSLSMWGGALGGMIVAGRQVAEQIIEEEPVEVVFFDGAPPPPPPPPPAGGGSKPKTEKPKDPDPEPQEPDPEPQPDPEPTPEPEPEEAAADAGQVGGVEGGVEGGVVGGVVGGEIGGVLGGQLGGTGTIAIHHSQVKVKRRVDPSYPEAARLLKLEKETCKAKLIIDEKGKPTEAEITGCSAVFHDGSRDAVLQWRFYPYIDNGRPVKATFTVALTYLP